MLSPLDYVLLQLGSPGKYQIFVAFLICCLQIPISFTGNLWTYYADEPPHRCLIKTSFSNGTAEHEWIPIHVKDKVKSFSSCEMYIDAHNHWKGTQDCLYGWDYRPPEKYYNIITEWDLVCHRKYLVDILFYFTHLSAILAAFFAGILSDKFGRKPILLISLYLFVITAFSVHFFRNFIYFSVGFCFQIFFASVSS